MAKLVQIYYKFNTPRARWQQAPSVEVGHMFSPNYKRKYVLDNGVEFTRDVGEELFNDDGTCPGWEN